MPYTVDVYTCIVFLISVYSYDVYAAQRADFDNSATYMGTVRIYTNAFM